MSSEPLSSPDALSGGEPSVASYRALAEMLSAFTYRLRVDQGDQVVPEWIDLGFTDDSGISPGEVFSRGGWQHLVHPADLPAVARQRRLLLAGQPASAEYRLVAPNGETRWLRDHAVPERNGQLVVAILGAIQDVTPFVRLSDGAGPGSANGEPADLALLDDFPTLVWRAAPNGQRVYFNKAWLDFTDLPAEAQIDDGWIAAVHPEDSQRVYAAFSEAVAGRRAATAEYRLRHCDGSYHWLLDFGRPYYNPNGELAGFIGSGYDISERKRSEQELRDYTERLRGLHDLAEAILAIRPAATIARTALQHVRRLVPCPWAAVFSFDLASQRATTLAMESSRPTALQDGAVLALTQFTLFEELSQDHAIVIDDVLPLDRPAAPLLDLRAEGIRSYIGVPLRLQGELIGTLSLAADRPAAFTARDLQIVREVAAPLAIAIQNSRLWDQARSANERLQTLSRRLLEAQEADRRHVARELHDEIGQALTAVKINLQASQRSLEHGSGPAVLAESIAVTEAALSQVRNLALDLRPSLLDDLGLVSALRWHLDRQAQRGGFDAHLTVDGCLPALTPAVEIACYRIVQEALTNVIRHAEAQHVTVTLSCLGPELRMSVRDDGTGFDVTAARERAMAGSSMGLLGMEERANLADGRLEFMSTPGQGSEIRAVFSAAQRLEGH